MKVLLIDETPITRSCYRVLLERLPEVKEIYEAGTGEQAVQQCQAADPDLIVIDIDKRDGGSGGELTQQLLSQCERAALIAISAHPEPRQANAVLQAGGAAYILKKLGFDELLQAIKAVSMNEVYVSEGLLEDQEEMVTAGENTTSASPTTPLTAREREVLRYVAQGHSSRNIARTLGLSLKTVETHRLHITKKLEIHNVAALTKYAIRKGIARMDD